MNIYLLNRVGPTDYYRLSGLVVIAESMENARKLALTSSNHQYYQSDKDGESWEREDPEYWDRDVDLWVDESRSTCVMIGKSSPKFSQEPTIVLEDFRAS